MGKELKIIMTKNTMEFGTERDDPFFDEEWNGMKRGDWKKGTI